jgi:hypothetical protein
MKIFVAKYHAPLPVTAATTIQPEAPVGVNPATGLARTFAASDLFAGFNAPVTCDNSSGANGDTTVSSISGSVVIPVTSATAADVGSTVYCTAAGVYDLTSTTDTAIGVLECCTGIYSASGALVAIKTFRD